MWFFLGTPQTQDSEEVDKKITMINESPFSTPGLSLTKKTAELDINGSSANKNYHPIFTKQTKTVSEIETDFFCLKDLSYL